MNRNLLASFGVLFLAAASGCAMGDSSLDFDYGTYGGTWQRTNPTCGRVGSIIDPAGAHVAPQQTKASPAQQPDDGPASVLVPEAEEPQQEPPLGTEEPLPDMLPADDSSPDAEPSALPPKDAEAEVTKAEVTKDAEAEVPEARPVEAAPFELGPADPASEMELPDRPASTEDSDEMEKDPVDELPDFLEELGIKREPAEPLQPLESGDLPPLVPSTDTDR